MSSQALCRACEGRRKRCLKKSKNFVRDTLLVGRAYTSRIRGCATRWSSSRFDRRRRCTVRLHSARFVSFRFVFRFGFVLGSVRFFLLCSVFDFNFIILRVWLKLPWCACVCVCVLCLPVIPFLIRPSRWLFYFQFSFHFDRVRRHETRLTQFNFSRVPPEWLSSDLPCLQAPL